MMRAVRVGPEGAELAASDAVLALFRLVAKLREPAKLAYILEQVSFSKNVAAFTKGVTK
jgi:hypothetical protein